MERKRYGLVTVETNDLGEWLWIIDDERTVHCEIDCGLTLEGVPQELHKDLTVAYNWAREDNLRRLEESRASDRDDL